MLVDLHTISEEIFPLIELHGTQKKCGVKDKKTTTQGNSNSLLEVF